jgi:hypothetical protein
MIPSGTADNLGRQADQDHVYDRAWIPSWNYHKIIKGYYEQGHNDTTPSSVHIMIEM